MTSEKSTPTYLVEEIRQLYVKVIKAHGTKVTMVSYEYLII